MQNGLRKGLDGLPSFDKRRSSHEFNTVFMNLNPLLEAQTDKNQSNLSIPQHSKLQEKRKSEHLSNESIQTNLKYSTALDSTSINTKSSASPILSEGSFTIPMNEHESSSTSIFDYTSISSSLNDACSTTSINSSFVGPLLKHTSRESIITCKNDKPHESMKKLSRTKPPKIIVRQPSDCSLASVNIKNSSMTSDEKQTSIKKRTSNVRHLSLDQRKNVKDNRKI